MDARTRYHEDPIFHALVTMLALTIDGAYVTQEKHLRWAEELDARFAGANLALVGIVHAADPIARLSIPGSLCTHCGATMDTDLLCPGCGWADPLTRRP